MTPPRLTMDMPHTPKQFADLLGMSEQWVRDRLDTLPGAWRESREAAWICPKIYMEARTQKPNRKN